MRVEKAGKIGFCFGVKRAINILEKVARVRGGVETLGAIVHNQPVLQRMTEIGVDIAGSVDDIKGSLVVTSAHGVSPRVEEAIRARQIDIINTTCPFVRRAQVVARRLAESGFFIIVYGDAAHPEIKGVLGWADNRGLATLDETYVTSLDSLPRHLGILSQTTQIPAHFNRFVRKLFDSALPRDYELRVIDTICHDIRERQAAALELANRVDMMLVIGGHTSANTNHLTEMCSAATETHLIETAGEIQPSWLREGHHIGITTGASTAGEAIDEVVARLEAMA
ncbi:4-hydroxy-3-methylbut-2-enyl diphosphate reductase [Chloroflexota bacterium]